MNTPIFALIIAIAAYYLFTISFKPTTSSIENKSNLQSTMKITLRKSSARGHADHGWLNSYHTFSFAGYHDNRFTNFGNLRVLNEDRVAPLSGFPTHPHRNAEIFSYILSGELTHRDSMISKGADASTASKHDFFRMKRGDLQFTSGGTGISHSETNEHKTDTVHFLQIWALPWRQGLKPKYRTTSFSDEAKRQGFVTLITPLKAGINASVAEQEQAVPALEGTIAINADFVMSASILAPGTSFSYRVGGPVDGVVKSLTGRKTYVHLPMTTKSGKAMIKLDGRDDAVLKEGDGAFVDDLKAGQELTFESVGEEDGEVVVLDSDRGPEY